MIPTQPPPDSTPATESIQKTYQQYNFIINRAINNNRALHQYEITKLRGLSRCIHALNQTISNDNTPDTFVLIRPKLTPDMIDNP
jgi:hypothetical protein